MDQQNTQDQYADFNASYIAQLAQARGYEYTPAIVGPLPEYSLYNNPKSNCNIYHKITFIVDGLECEYYTAEYTTPALADYPDLERIQSQQLTSRASSRFQVQVFAVSLPYDVEDLYVESMTNITLNNILGMSSVAFKNARRVNLEGDFNTFFRVYTPENEELTAFTILAPNIMVRLLEEAGDYDFEFSGNKVYFYQTFAYYTPGKIALKKAAYDNLLDFGINSAKAITRAGRPAQRPAIVQNIAMWQLFGMKSSNSILLILISVALFFLFFLSIMIPLLWPVAIIMVICFGYRYQHLSNLRKKLVRNWHAAERANFI